MTKRLLFVHGAGGYVDDQPLAEGIGAALGCAVDMPEFAETDMSFEGWATPVRRLLGELTPEDIVVAHSFGATILLRVLAEGTPFAPGRAALLAMPDWGPDGWDFDEYAFAGPQPDVALSLHHCRDDEVVPFEHLALGRALLPSAQVIDYPSGGHQFVGLDETVARDIEGGGEG
ncbi:MAG: alpha/beta hydrolase [Rhodococcus sp. (in: high G+C Gram-positive bacteria)]